MRVVTLAARVASASTSSGVERRRKPRAGRRERGTTGTTTGTTTTRETTRARAKETEEEDENDDDEAKTRARNELLVDTSSSPLRETISVQALRDATESGTRLERVVGAEFVPQAIIDAERKSSPLRRPRLVVYALSASAAAAQAVMVGMEPGNFESPVASALSDACVMVIGSLLWRVELQQRADSLRVIWEKAKEREESLTRAEAGLGDTIWTARVRAQKNKSAASTPSERDDEEEESS